jgi:futalosine hydrolase
MMDGVHLFPAHEVCSCPKILIVTAVQAEYDAVVRGLCSVPHAAHVLVSGIGPIAAAVHTTHALTAPYTAVLSLGIAGAYTAPHDAVCISTDIVCTDYGVQFADGTLGVPHGWPMRTYTCPPALVHQCAQAIDALQTDCTVVCGPILTVPYATGTAQTADVRRTLGCVAEAMEGYGIAAAAHACRVPMLEIRTISNTVGPRDTSSWRTLEALDRLTQIVPALVRKEVWSCSP